MNKHTTMQTSPRQKISNARTALILDQPFFGALALRLTIVEDTSHDTAWTDGIRLGYNPSFVSKLTQAEMVAVMAHEVMHCALGHPWRQGNREQKRCQIAADYAINPILVDAGFCLPSGVLLSEQFRGKSMEWIYDRLPETLPIGWTSLGETRNAPGNGGEQAEEDWRQAVRQAAASEKARGNLPDSLERLAGDAARPRVDWRSVLRRFVQSASCEDYSWRQPNRRYLSSGCYLPQLWSEELGQIAIAVDTSGSIDSITLEQFAAEIRAISQEMSPNGVTVMYCDCKVGRIDEFSRDEEITIRPVGGGGTDFRPVFEHLSKADELPVCLIYLTDLAGTFPDCEPAFPTMWVSTSDNTAVPFGEIVQFGER